MYTLMARALLQYSVAAVAIFPNARQGGSDLVCETSSTGNGRCSQRPGIADEFKASAGVGTRSA